MSATLRGVAWVVGWMLCAAASAQQYPNKPIRIITVGADPTMPRILAAELSGSLGQQVYVEEHAGASGTIGAALAARAPADGYTFMVATSTHMVTPHFYNLSYDILRDFDPVTLLASTPFVLLAHPSLPAKTPASMIKRMNAEVIKALRKPEVRKRVLGLAMDPGENTPEEFRSYMKAELARWTQAVKDANINIPKVGGG